MTFEAWLKKQIKRDDPAGDLANDFFGAKKIKGDKFQKCDEEHLDKWNACEGAYKALKQARKEYSNDENNRKI